jgi:CIC family chloride channel protein
MSAEGDATRVDSGVSKLVRRGTENVWHTLQTDGLLILLVAAVGIVSALSVRLFEALIEHSLELGFHRFPEYLSHLGLPQWAAYLIYPAALGLALAGVKLLVPQKDRIHSVPLVIISMDKRAGQISLLSTILKTLTSILTLGAGGSLGREGPVVLLGGGLGSAMGQVLRLPAEWLNTLIAAGAGAAIATAFHAPITGVFFALEIVLIQFSARSFALTALACVTAAQFSRLLVGAPPFPIPAYQMHSSWEIPLYIVLGLLITPVARIYVRVIYGAEELGAKVRKLPSWVKPAVGGILFGTLALLLPRTLGSGYDTITEALTGQLGLGLLLLLLVGKLLAIGLTSGSGWPGGVFTPALFLGSMAGGAYGMIAQMVFPGLVTHPGAFAVVGMAAMIAGATHAPLTAMMLIFEVTQDYRIALPAMIACGIATVFAQRLSPYSIDTVHLTEHGVLLPWQVQDLRAVHLADAMSPNVHTVQTGMLLKDVIEVMQRYRHGGYPVLNAEGKLVGMITLGDVRAVPLERRLQTPVESVMSKKLVTLTPAQTLADAAILMARRGVGRLLVVDPEDKAKLLGIISRSDVLRSYPTAENPEDSGHHPVFLER